MWFYAFRFLVVFKIGVCYLFYISKNNRKTKKTRSKNTRKNRRKNTEQENTSKMRWKTTEQTPGAKPRWGVLKRAVKTTEMIFNARRKVLRRCCTGVVPVLWSIILLVLWWKSLKNALFCRFVMIYGAEYLRSCENAVEGEKNAFCELFLHSLK